MNRFSLFLLSALALSSLPQLVNSLEDDDGTDNPKIFEGTIVTNPNEIPAFALLCFGGGDTNCGKCGGILIDSTHLLSAAHCIFSANGLPTNVRVGTLTSSGGESIEITNIVTHPDYTDTPLVSNDLAVITLASAATTTPLTINRNTAIPNSVTTSPVTAYGFGGIDADSTQSSVLRRATTVVQSDADCTRRWGINFDGTKHICTTEETEGICPGDSGGPIMDLGNTIILGILSFGTALCAEGTEDVWVDVANYAGWIDQQTSGVAQVVVEPQLEYGFFPDRDRQPLDKELADLQEQTTAFYTEVMQLAYPDSFQSFTVIFDTVEYNPANDLPVKISFTGIALFNADTTVPTGAEVFQTMASADYEQGDGGYIWDFVWQSPLGLFYDADRVVFGAQAISTSAPSIAPVTFGPTNSVTFGPSLAPEATAPIAPSTPVTSAPVISSAPIVSSAPVTSSAPGPTPIPITDSRDVSVSGFGNGLDATFAGMGGFDATVRAFG